MSKNRLSNMKVLVLDASYEPVNVATVKRALKMIYKGIAKAEEETPAIVYSTKMWDENTGEYITIEIHRPEVIRLVEYKYIPKRMQILTRKNIFIRDGYKCIYCGIKQSYSELTLDHVIPRAHGGKSTWDNLVTCCHECNLKKGSKLLSELDMQLSHPISNTSHSARNVLRLLAYEKPAWQKYLFF
jgi:hypothetical protein